MLSYVSQHRVPVSIKRYTTDSGTLYNCLADLVIQAGLQKEQQARGQLLSEGWLICQKDLDERDCWAWRLLQAGEWCWRDLTMFWWNFFNLLRGWCCYFASARSYN